MFPESFTFSIADWVNGWVDSLVTNYGDVFRHISDTLLWAIVNLEGLLRAAPWWLMLAIVGGIAWHATRGGHHLAGGMPGDGADDGQHQPPGRRAQQPFQVDDGPQQGVGDVPEHIAVVGDQ